MDPMIHSPAFAGRVGNAAPRSLSPDASDSRPQLLAIERELAGPGAQEALARHDAILVGLENRLAAALDQGVSPEEYPKLTALREANVLARKLLRLATRDGKSNNP